MKAAFHVVLCGAAGRMGRAIAAAAAADKRFALAGITRANAAALPEELGRAHALVDFSAPAASLSFAAAAAKRRVPAVIGTTGFAPSQLRRLKALSRRIPLLCSPNMSPGMNLLIHLTGIAAKSLAGYDAAVSEVHHRLKKDAPSGSAKLLAQAVSAARPGDARVPTVSLRLGDVVGDHSLLLAGPGESLELAHRAFSREVFARGALSAALWLRGRRPGWYTMRDMLGLP